MEYLALGIRHEDGSTNSMAVCATDKETVHDLMENEFSVDFDVIFLIKNAESCPEVAFHFTYE